MPGIRQYHPIFLLAAIALTVTPADLPGQSSRDSVVAVVNEFFRAMAAGDSASAAKTVHAQGMSYAFRVRGDSATGRFESLSRFAPMIANSKQKLVERMWEPTVHVHGPIAVVWTQYDFHVDGKFSHCGIDAFTVARMAEGWRIVNIAYTTEQAGCKPSPLGPIKTPGS